MSSHRNPNLPSDRSPSYYGGGSEAPVTRQLGSPAGSWPQTAASGDQSGYSQPDPSLDPVGNSLNVHDAGDMNFTSSFPDPGYSVPNTSRDLGVGTSDATHLNDDIPSFVNQALYSYPGFDYAEYQHQHDYARYDQAHDLATQPFVFDVTQHPTQGIHIPQTSQGHFTPVHPISSPQFFAGPVYRTGTSAALPVPRVDTARIDASAGQHSHPSPVVTASTNRNSSSIPSHPPPSSPERKRLLPLTADDTARRVMPRHAGTSDVHSTNSGSRRRSNSNSDVHGRGPWIPQARYTTSTITSLHDPDCITFHLEKPDQNGIPITDVLDKTDVLARLLGRTETFDMGKKTFTLRVQWPGYRPWSKTIAAQDWTKTRGPVTRLKLADAVATGIRDLFDKYRDEPYDPDYAPWNVGPNGIQLNQICLVSLHHVSRGSWQPALCLVAPRG